MEKEIMQKRTLIILFAIFILSMIIGVTTYDGSIKGTQLLWLLTLMLEYVYLDYEVNKDEN